MSQKVGVTRTRKLLFVSFLSLVTRITWHLNILTKFTPLAQETELSKVSNRVSLPFKNFIIRNNKIVPGMYLETSRTPTMKLFCEKLVMVFSR